jgi:multidrug resistance efflux pump
VGGPLPKRPKGSLFVGSLLLLIVGTVSYAAWNTAFRYASYGTVTGNTLAVGPPWPGTVESLFVREGDLVRQGDALAHLVNAPLQHEIERLGDELRLAQSELDAHVAELTLAAQQSRDRQQLALAEYYRLMGEFLAEQAKLSDLVGRMARNERLSVKGAVAGQDEESARLAAAGQQAKVERLELAVAELKKRTESVEPADQGSERLKPKLVRIEQIQANIQRARERQREGTIRAPAGGRVLAVKRQVGEYVDPATPVVEILDEQSVAITLLVPQDRTRNYEPGQRIEVELAPRRERLACKITRVGDEFLAPPPQIETRFRHGERLLPVILRPVAAPADDIPLRIGSEVRQPRGWSLQFLWGA